MGREMYLLHDNGRKLFTDAQTCTPMQRFVYVMARNHHSEDEDPRPPQGVKEAKRFTQATSRF